MQMRMQLIEESPSHKREIDVSCARGLKVDDERGEGRGPFVRVCEEGYLYSDRFPIIGGTNDRGCTDGKEGSDRRGEEEEGESVRDRDSSLGSHVLSQFGVPLPPVPFSRLSRPVARFLLRFVARFSLPLPHLLTSSHGVETSRPPRIFYAKTCMRMAPSRVKRQIHLDARGSSCRLSDRVTLSSQLGGAEFNEEYIIFVSFLNGLKCVS